MSNIPPSGPESTPQIRVEKGREINVALARIASVNHGLTLQGLGRSQSICDLFEGADIDKLHVRPESRILQAHFPAQGDIPACPIVPLTTLIALGLLKKNTHTVRCTVHAATLPDDIIHVTPLGIRKGDKMAVAFDELQAGDTELGRGLELPAGIELEKRTNFTLPHGEDFRFVRFIEASEDDTHFLGRYTLPAEFDIALLPEVVAQMGAAVGSTRKLEPGSIYVYKGGVFNYAKDTSLLNGDTLRVTGRVINAEGRNCSFLFSVRTARDNAEVFWGQVDAQSLPYKLLVRGCTKKK